MENQAAKGMPCKNVPAAQMETNVPVSMPSVEGLQVM